MLWLAALFVGTPAIVVGLLSSSGVLIRLGVVLYMWAAATFVISCFVLAPTIRMVERALETLRDRDKDS